jgi:hypothetical protein
MLRINGEITAFINDCEFETKEEFMNNLRFLRKNAKLHPDCKYEYFYDLIGVAIQQAYYANPNQIIRYKNYCNLRKETSK